MKYSEIIAEVKELYPNGFSDSQYIKWLLELENSIAQETGAGIRKNIDLEKDTAIGVPFDRMYIDFLMAQVAFHQHDDESYERYMAMYNSRYRRWQAFYIRTVPGAKHQFKNWT